MSAGKETNHCRDCCCAESWRALGVSEYDGKGIPEHIAELRAKVERLRWVMSRVHIMKRTAASCPACDRVMADLTRQYDKEQAPTHTKEKS